MAAAPQIPAKVVEIMELIQGQMSTIIAELEDINNRTSIPNPIWEEIEELMTDTELKILYAEEDAKELQKLANKEGFPAHMMVPIDEQMRRLSEMLQLISTIKSDTIHRDMGSAMNQQHTIEDVRSGLNELLPLAHETEVQVAAFHQQVINATGGSRRRRYRKTRRSKRSKRSKRKQCTRRRHRRRN